MSLYDTPAGRPSTAEAGLPDRAAGAGPATVGYVLKMFPRLSETFILTEILAREAAGEHIEIASLRSPIDGRFHTGLGSLRATVTWVPYPSRQADRLWTALREARAVLPRLDAMLPDLLELPFEDAVQAISVAQWAVDMGITHLHAHFATASATVARLASLLTGIPYSFTAHAKDIFHESVSDAELEPKFADAHHVVTVSDYNLADLTARHPASAARLHRVYNGLDLTALPMRAAQPAGVSLVAVGRLVEKKGFADLIDAVAILRERGTELPTLIVGGGRLEEELATQVVACGLHDLVVMAGARGQHETHAAIQSATMLAAPVVVAPDGDRDGLPTVLLEAMALGTPVISTPVTGIPEAVIDGQSGLLVPERDPFALADALHRLIDQPLLARRLAVGARRRVEERFDVRRQAASLAALCRTGEPAVPASGRAAARVSTAPVASGVPA